MALTGANLISRIQDTLQDSTGVRWPEAELLRYINDAQREIVNFKPEAKATHANVTLSTGTEQSLPSGGIRLIKVVRNMASAASDAAAGKVIRIVDLDILNTQDPDWHDPNVTGDSAHGTVVKHYAFDPDDPKKYYVYPGVSGSAYAEVVYSASPTDLSATSDTIDIDDIYGNAIVDFVLYRAYLKDAEYAGNAQRASTHYSLFTNSIGAGTNAQRLINPNLDSLSSKPVQMPGV